MKLFILIIVAILISIYPELTTASETAKFHLPTLDIPVSPKTEKGDVNYELKNRELLLRDGKSIKNDIKRINEITKEYIPIRIEIEKAKKADREKMGVFQKYIECINTSPEEGDCEEIEAKLDSLNVLNNTQDVHVPSRSRLNKIEDCANVAREFFPDFNARIKLNIKIDSAGYPVFVEIDRQNSFMNYPIENFPECVAEFSKDLNFQNQDRDFAVLSYSFIF